MTEQHMPARIWATEFENRVELWTIKPKTHQHVFIRADIAEGMADALERSLSWLSSYPGEGALGAYEQARSALSAFRSATQDTEAR